jgi:hypothetical protein
MSVKETERDKHLKVVSRYYDTMVHPTVLDAGSMERYFKKLEYHRQLYLDREILKGGEHLDERRK